MLVVLPEIDYIDPIKREDDIKMNGKLPKHRWIFLMIIHLNQDSKVVNKTLIFSQWD